MFNSMPQKPQKPSIFPTKNQEKGISFVEAMKLMSEGYTFFSLGVRFRISDNKFQYWNNNSWICCYESIETLMRAEWFREVRDWKKCQKIPEIEYVREANPGEHMVKTEYGVAPCDPNLHFVLLDSKRNETLIDRPYFEEKYEYVKEDNQ